MKKILFFLLLLSGLAQAQGYIIPDFTLSLSQAPNSILDSSIALGNGNPIQRIKYTHDWNERLVLKNRRDTQQNQSEVSTFNYDLNDSVVQKTYASGQSAPTLTALTVITRNQLKQVEHDTVSYASGPQYTLNSASIYSYDATGNLAEVELSTYNNGWSVLNRRQYQRNSGGKITNTLFQGWVNNVWVNGSQNNSTYNSNNDITEQIFQTWNTTSSVWLNLSRSHWDYTGTHVDTFMTYSWVNTWVKNSRYTYSPAGALDSVTIDSWNGTQWEGYKRYVRTWAQGRITSITEKGFTNTWQNAWKHEYVYDSNGDHTVTNLYAYNNPSNPWALIIVTNHYYRASTVGIAEHSLNDTRTYPVPSGGILYFDSAQPVKGGTVYSAGGHEAISFQGSSVDLSVVPPGVYYVKLLLEDGNFRMVKAIRE